MSEVTQTARSNWIPMVEYLRGLAALGVTWFHLTNSYGNGWVRASGAYGWLGVEVFFVISGFIIPYFITRAYTNYSLAQFPQFVLRRLLRLEPPYLISVVLALALWHLSSMMPGFAGTPPPHSWWQAMAHIAYLIPFTEYQWYNPVYWTLAYEFAFYFAIGIAYPWVCVTGKPLLWILLAAGIAVLVVSDPESRGSDAVAKGRRMSRTAISYASRIAWFDESSGEAVELPDIRLL